MIIDDDEVAARRPRSPPFGSSASTMSMTPFPVAPHLDLSFYRHNNNTNNSLPQHHGDPATETLLPYAFRHPQPHSFEQYPGAAESSLTAASGAGAAAWRLQGTRFKLLVIIAGASLLFLLHDHFFRPRGPHPRSPWDHGPGHHPFDDHGPPPPAPPVNPLPAVVADPSQLSPPPPPPPPPAAGALDARSASPQPGAKGPLAAAVLGDVDG